MTIHPTHTCFDDAIDYLEELGRELLAGNGSPLLECTLVHAICLHPDDGHPFAHAWVEHGDEAIWVGIIEGERYWIAADKKEHNESLRVQDRTEYTPHQAMLENQKSGHFGPWLERYDKLCRDGGKRRPDLI